VYEGVDIPNVNLFREQVETFRDMLKKAPPSGVQAKNVDYSMAMGEMFTLIPYAQGILENVKNYNIGQSTVDEIFNFMVRDFSQYALTVYTNFQNSPEQEKFLLSLIRKPVIDEAKFAEVWEKDVLALKDKYVMNE
jgi:acyl-CoA dehydrogenase